MYVYLKVESFFEKKNLKVDKMYFKLVFIHFRALLMHLWLFALKNCYFKK